MSPFYPDASDAQHWPVKCVSSHLPLSWRVLLEMVLAAIAYTATAVGLLTLSSPILVGVSTAGPVS